MEKQYGNVKFYDNRRGWGFIAGDNGSDVFVHHTSIVMDGFRKLNAGQFVSFNVGSDDKGRECACEVKVIAEGSAV